MSVLARARQSFRPVSVGSGEEPGRSGGGRKRQGLDAELHSFIGERLRLYYADLLQEPVPERFVTILEKLESSEGRRS